MTAVVTDKRVDGYGVLHRVGLIGWREGGWIAPLAAAREPGAIAYVVLVSAPVVSPLEQVGYLTEQHAGVGAVLAGTGAGWDGCWSPGWPAARCCRATSPSTSGRS